MGGDAIAQRLQVRDGSESLVTLCLATVRSIIHCSATLSWLHHLYDELFEVGAMVLRMTIGNFDTTNVLNTQRHLYLLHTCERLLSNA